MIMFDYCRKQFVVKLIWNIKMSGISFKYSHGADVTKSLKDTIIVAKLLKFSRFEIKRMTRILHNAGMVHSVGLNDHIFNDLMRSALKPTVAVAIRVAILKLCEEKEPESNIHKWLVNLLDAHFKEETKVR